MASRGFEFPVSAVSSSIPVLFGSSASSPPTPLSGVTAADAPTPLPGVTAAWAPRTPLMASAAYAPTPFFPGTAACAPTPFFGGNAAYMHTPYRTADYTPTPLFGASTVCPRTPFFDPIPAQSSTLDFDVSLSTPGTAFSSPPTPFNTPSGNSRSTFVTPATSPASGTSATQSSSASQQSLRFRIFDSSSSTTGATTNTIPLCGEATALTQTTTCDAVTVPFSSGQPSTTKSAANPRFTFSSSEASVTTPAPSVIANFGELDRPMEIAGQLDSFNLMLRQRMKQKYATIVGRDQLYESVSREEVGRDWALIEGYQAQADRDSLQTQHDEARERERQMQMEVQQLYAKIDALKVEQDRMRGELEKLHQIEVQQLCTKIDALKVEQDRVQQLCAKIDALKVEQDRVQQLCVKIDALKIEQDRVRGELETLHQMRVADIRVSQKMDALTIEIASLREALGRPQGHPQGFVLL
ncbi:uncharacterized protein LOC131874848 [Cryptomeria japonica]|uniref:uncharacterized protein LOC131874848 n=1 Tax=Cryptomeria japonica TaxID=3369 RepID=UPI0027DA5966|nr:uncharacterized protein LOC131874848 [Cryptomeria japonica]